MDDVRDVLNSALPDTPPANSISREGAIAAGRRARTRRSWMIAGAAGTSTLVLASGLAAATVWGHGSATTPGLSVGSALTVAESTTPVPTATASPLTTGTRGPDAPPVPMGTPGGQPVEPAVGERDADPALTAAFKAAFAAVDPNAVAKPVPAVTGPGAHPDLDTFEAVRDPYGGFYVRANIQDAAGSGSFMAYLSKQDFTEAKHALSEGCAISDPGFTCTTASGPGGEAILITTGPVGNGATAFNLTVAKPDGTQIKTSVQNTTNQDDPAAQAERPTPPLTTAQITTLLLSAGITLAGQ